VKPSAHEESALDTSAATLTAVGAGVARLRASPPELGRAHAQA